MKAFNFLFIAVGILLISCSTSNNVIRDDAYYSPYDKKSNNELIVSNNGTFNTSKISSNSQYDYQSYYSEGDEHKPKAEPLYEKTETVTDTNGVVYTSTETYYDQNYLTSSGAAYLQDNYDYYYDEDDELKEMRLYKSFAVSNPWLSETGKWGRPCYDMKDVSNIYMYEINPDCYKEGE